MPQLREIENEADAQGLELDRLLADLDKNGGDIEPHGLEDFDLEPRPVPLWILVETREDSAPAIAEALHGLDGVIRVEISDGRQG